MSPCLVLGSAVESKSFIIASHERKGLRHTIINKLEVKKSLTVGVPDAPELFIPHH